MLRYTDGRVRICQNRHTTFPFQAWCGKCFLTQFGLLIPSNHHLEHHRLFEYCRWPCASPHGYNLPSSNGYFLHDNGPCLKSKGISNWFHEHFNEFSVPGSFQSLHLNPAENLRDVAEQEYESAPERSAGTTQCSHINMEQDLKGKFSTSKKLNLNLKKKNCQHKPHEEGKNLLLWVSSI